MGAHVKRSATDAVVLTLTWVVAGTIMVLVIGLVIGRIMHPEIEYRAVAEMIEHITTTVVGALVGFIGGRAAGRVEGANGVSHT